LYKIIVYMTCADHLPLIQLIGYEYGSVFIPVLCKALRCEYSNTHHPASNKKRSLDQVFTAVVIPEVCQWSYNKETYTVKQTPEYRTSLSKNIRFEPVSKHAETFNSPASLIYDGEKDDKSFEPGRTLWPLKKLYVRELRENNWKDEREYQVLLKTVYAVASKELPAAQRAGAWVIINRAKKEWGGSTIEGVCRKIDRWQKPIRSINMTYLNAIDKWLPNVEQELKGWDPSRGSLDFLKHPEKKEISAFGTRKYDYVSVVKIGKIQFYKYP